MELRTTFHQLLCSLALVFGLVSPSAATPAGFTCEVSLGIAEPFISIGRLDFDLFYSAAEITMSGSGAQVACRGLANEVGGGVVPATFDDDDLGTVSGTLISTTGFPGFTPLALCALTAAFVAETDDFTAVLMQALEPGGAPVNPQPAIQVTGVDCVAGTTTTLDTTTTTSTTTTLAPPTTTSTTLFVGTTTTTTLAPISSCGDPDGSGTFTASDSLFVLRTSVRLASCAPQICDVDSSGSISATDALRLLRAAVGLGDSLECPA
jgi:hypothetical protein